MVALSFPTILFGELIGVDDGEVLSNDPETAEAQLAEASGHSVACGEFTAQLTLIELNDMHFLLGSAHAFYEDGNLKCTEGFGFFYPDYHYKGTASESIDPGRNYRFAQPPLNNSLALKNSTGAVSPDSNRDFVILQIEDYSLLLNQLGEERTAFSLA